MSDYLIRALAYNGQVRAFAVRTTETVSEAQKRHDTWPTASAALGRAMTAGVMMGAMLKGSDKLTIKIEGRGPIGSIIVDSDGNGHVRGYVTNPHVHFELNNAGKLDVARAVGVDGYLAVVKDQGLKEYFSGQVPIVSGELGEDFTYYFASSEQTPSSVGVGVLVNPDNTILAAGGFIIQLLPNTNTETIDLIEKRLKTIEPISTLIQKGLSPEGILEAVLGEGTVKVLGQIPIKFECSCSKERIENAIKSLGREEVENIIETEGKAEAQCHFCNEVYNITKDELTNLLHNE